MSETRRRGRVTEEEYDDDNDKYSKVARDAAVAGGGCIVISLLLCLLVAVLLGGAALIVMNIFLMVRSGPTFIEPSLPDCPSTYLCSSEPDCPTIGAVDFREMTWWNVNESSFTLVQECFIGRCLMSHYMILYEPNWTEMGFGENWTETVLTTLTNLTNSSYTEPTWITSIYRGDYSVWGDVLSSLCMSYIHADYRTDLVAYLDYLDWDGTYFVTQCYYTYNCHATFDFPGSIPFPAYIA